MRLNRVVKRNVGTSSVWWEDADAKYERTASPSTLCESGLTCVSYHAGRPP